MDSEQLKARQPPLKAKYRDTPDAAVKLTERYCVVAQSLRQAPEFTIRRAA